MKEMEMFRRKRLEEEKGRIRRTMLLIRKKRRSSSRRRKGKGREGERKDLKEIILKGRQIIFE